MYCSCLVTAGAVHWAWSVEVGAWFPLSLKSTCRLQMHSWGSPANLITTRIYNKISTRILWVTKTMKSKYLKIFSMLSLIWIVFIFIIFILFIHCAQIFFHKMKSSQFSIWEYTCKKMFVVNIRFTKFLYLRDSLHQAKKMKHKFYESSKIKKDIWSFSPGNWNSAELSQLSWITVFTYVF